MPIFHDLYDSSSLPSIPAGYVNPNSAHVEVDTPDAAELELKVAVSELARIAALDVQSQDAQIGSTLAQLRKCMEIFNEDRTCFTAEITKKIIHTLPKLPLEPQHFKKIVAVLLERAFYLAEQNQFNRQQSVQILASMAKLNVDLYKHDRLVTLLLKNFVLYQEGKINLSTSMLSELWQFCAFALIDDYKTDEINPLCQLAEEDLDTRELTMETSLFQDDIMRVFTHLLTSTALQELTKYEEYCIGAYSLDIAFLSRKLNIEVDGPHHYREQTLTRHSQFRDFLLERQMGWTVIRIPHFTWNSFSNGQQKIDYILGLMRSHAILLNESAKTRLIKLNPVTPKKALNLFDCDLISDKQDIDEADAAPVTKGFLDRSRYLSEVFSKKLSGAASWKSKNGGDVIKLGNRIHKSERDWFEAKAKEARLDVTFKKSDTKHGFFYVKISKDSAGLKKAMKIISGTGFFNHNEDVNDNSRIVNLICEYGRKLKK
jgi:very-short-patch-repair endonuclease